MGAEEGDSEEVDGLQCSGTGETGDGGRGSTCPRNGHIGHVSDNRPRCYRRWGDDHGGDTRHVSSCNADSHSGGSAMASSTRAICQSNTGGLCAAGTTDDDNGPLFQAAQRTATDRALQAWAETHACASASRPLRVSTQHRPPGNAPLILMTVMRCSDCDRQAPRQSLTSLTSLATGSETPDAILGPCRQGPPSVHFNGYWTQLRGALASHCGLQRHIARFLAA